MRKPIYHLLAILATFGVVGFMISCIPPLGGLGFVLPGQEKVIGTFPRGKAGEVEAVVFGNYSLSKGWAPADATLTDGGWEDMVSKGRWTIGVRSESADSSTVEEFVQNNFWSFGG